MKEYLIKFINFKAKHRLENIFILLFFTVFIKELMFFRYLTNNIKTLICHVLHYISFL